MRTNFIAVLFCFFFPLYGLLASTESTREKVEHTLHIYRPLPRVEAKRYGSFQVTQDITVDRVSYRTAYHLRVPALVYHPAKNKDRRPALIIVNGHGGDKSSWYAYWAGILYARAGGVVLTYDPIGEFERNHLRASNTNQHDAVIAPDDMGRRMGGLMVEDVLAAVHYLSRRKDVDRKRVAVLGYSMGSFISSLACAVEPRIRACVLVGGGDLDGPGGYWDSSSKKMCQSTPYKSLNFLGDRGAQIYALQASHGRTLVVNGREDKVVDIPNHSEQFFSDLRRRTAEIIGGKERALFEYQFVNGGGHRPYFVTKPVAVWLQQQLNFPNWSEAKLQQMPETSIAGWARDTGLAAPSLQNALGEGGTLALGSGVPALNRSLLRALPEAEWQESKDRYVYESWVAAASAAIRSSAP